MTVYVPDDLAAEVKAQLGDANISAICQAALRDELDRHKALNATLGEAKTYKLDVREPNGYGGSDDITVRLHGTRIAEQPISGHGSTEVYRGQDGKIYVHDFQGELHRDVEPDDLGKFVTGSKYIEAMHAIGQVPVIDVGLPEGER